MNTIPFTVSADLDLGERVTSFLSSQAADVAIFEGSVPQSIKDEGGGVAYQIAPGKMLLNLPNGTRIFIEDGERIIYHRGENCTDKDIALFVLGSAWGALCYQRGLIPLHASAVIVDGYIYAFTGHSGSGKSTLAAGLSAYGLDFFTDDVLIYDPSESADKAICYAGQKDLKLWGDAVTLTNSVATGRIRDTPDLDKHFARPNKVSTKTKAPLSKLFILDRTNTPDSDKNLLTPLTGAVAFKTIIENMYRPRYAEVLMGRPALFAAMGQLIKQIKVTEFKRYFHDSNFHESVEFLAKHLVNEPHNKNS